MILYRAGLTSGQIISTETAIDRRTREYMQWLKDNPRTHGTGRGGTGTWASGSGLDPRFFPQPGDEGDFGKGWTSDEDDYLDPGA
jgi:hypothetical protein